MRLQHMKQHSKSQITLITPQPTTFSPSTKQNKLKEVKTQFIHQLPSIHGHHFPDSSSLCFSTPPRPPRSATPPPELEKPSVPVEEPRDSGEAVV